MTPSATVPTVPTPPPAAVRPPDPSAGPVRRHWFWLLPLAVAAILAAPHLSHPFWQDEVTTEVRFANDPLAALTHYQIPNNHILFSLQWWAFRQMVADPALWRLLPFAFFLAAVLFMVLAGRRLTRDPLGGALVGMVFATAHPALSFGAELRGYSPSMAYVAVALYALACWRERPRRTWLVLYGIMAFFAVGTVPVNLAAFAPLALWVWWTTRPGRSPEALPAAAGHWKPSLWCALVPFSGLALLLPVLRQLPRSYTEGASMAKPAFLAHYPYAAVWDFLWLPGLAGLAVCLSRLAARRARRRTADPAAAEAVPPPAAAKGEGREALAFLGLSVAVPMACALVLPRTPNDYTMVATMPAICLGLGWTAWAAWLRTGTFLSVRARHWGFGAVLAALLVLGGVREFHTFGKGLSAMSRFDLSPWLVDAAGVGVQGYNLYWQKFQNNDDAIALVDHLARQLGDDRTTEAFIFDHSQDPLTHLMHWEWRYRVRYPNSIYLYTLEDGLNIAKQRPEVARVWAQAWADAGRRFLVLDRGVKEMPGRVLNLLTPGQRGVTMVNFTGAELICGEWYPDLAAAQQAKRAAANAVPPPSLVRPAPSAP